MCFFEAEILVEKVESFYKTNYGLWLKAAIWRCQLLESCLLSPAAAVGPRRRLPWNLRRQYGWLAGCLQREADGGSTVTSEAKLDTDLTDKNTVKLAAQLYTEVQTMPGRP